MTQGRLRARGCWIHQLRGPLVGCKLGSEVDGKTVLLGIHPGSPGPGGRVAAASHLGRSIFGFELDKGKKDAEKGLT